MPALAQPTLAPGEKPAVERLAYSPAEAATALGISRARLYQLLEDGTLASIKLGGRRLIRVGALVDMLDRLQAAS